MTTKKDFLKIIKSHLDLSEWGMGDPWAYKINKVDKEESRLSLQKNGLEEFKISCKWLSKVEKRKTVNPKRSSYGWKHIVENDMNHYISNGAFIVAVLYMEIQYKRNEGSPNINVGISEKALRNDAL